MCRFYEARSPNPELYYRVASNGIGDAPTQKSPPRPLILWRHKPRAPNGTHSVVPPLCERSEFADPLTFPSINGCSLYVIWPARLIESKLDPFSTFGCEQ